VNKIPKFKSIKEEARFWDTHNVTDYLEDLEPVKLVAIMDPPTKETLAIRVQPTLKKRMEKIAQSYGINLSTLARMWLIDKLKDWHAKQDTLT
jgi:predicted HicB family RNase H-like nuclease